MKNRSFHNVNKVGHLFGLTEKNPLIGTDCLNLLDEVEQLYEQLQQISSVSHKAKNFSVAIFGSARFEVATLNRTHNIK